MLLWSLGKSLHWGLFLPITGATIFKRLCNFGITTIWVLAFVKGNSLFPAVVRNKVIARSFVHMRKRLNKNEYFKCFTVIYRKMGTVMVLKTLKTILDCKKLQKWMLYYAYLLQFCFTAPKSKIRQMYACMLLAITFPSEIASSNCRAQHINKNVSWVKGILLSQLCQRCDCEMEKMVSLLQKFTHTHWASVSRALLTRHDICSAVMSLAFWKPTIHTSA